MLKKYLALLSVTVALTNFPVHAATTYTVAYCNSGSITQYACYVNPHWWATPLWVRNYDDPYGASWVSNQCAHDTGEVFNHNPTTVLEDCIAHGGTSLRYVDYTIYDLAPKKRTLD